MRSRRRPGRGRSSTPGTPPRSRAALAVGLVLALVASLLHVPTAFADPAPRGWPGVAQSESVPGAGVAVRPRPPDPVVESAVTAPKAAREVARPKAGSAEVAVAAEPVRAAELPVRVGVANAKSPQRVRVEVLDRPVAEKAGVGGVLFRVQRADGAADAGPVTVDVDYSSFRDEFGGDYASRLSLVRLPACAAWAPERAECVTGTPLPASNDVRGSRIRGEITASGTPRVPDDEKQRRRVTAPDVLYAVTAASGGSAGTFKPTSLSPSATWEVGLQSGDFSWAYPLDLPPVPGPEPEVALSYSSGGIDGRTAASNNQASWIGEGFDFQPGFIERQYTSCASDAAGGNNATPTGDLCYASANAVVALPGVAGELVHDAGRGVWRAEQDDGWRVDQLFGADNGDNDGEHWRMTAPDGTQYFFGLRAAARSAWTVPVFGNQPGEPCHASSFASSWCQQAYRWMLDRVVDRHGDTIAYYYDTDTNHYGRNNIASLATPFVRSGQLARIDYGLRDGQAEPAARVVFTAEDRCLPGSACVRSQPADWPDVPWDQQCDGGTCVGKHSPVFFGAKRLAKITSQVRRDGQLTDVDSWTLHHLFPATHDATSPGLWLESITHTGHVGGTAVTPDVNFDGVLLDNRVVPDPGRPLLKRWRVGRVHTETGGEIQVTYAPHGCVPGDLPVPDDNGLPCYPANWSPEGTSAPELDWFHKYLVTEVREIDRVGGSPDEVTSYEYPAGAAAWHHDDAELVPDALKSWGQWRGYHSVKVRTGDPSGPRTLVEHRFFRGMWGDRKADGTTRKDEIGGRPDDPALRGFSYEEITYDGDGGPEVEREITEPEVIGPNAVRRRASGNLGAYVTEVKKTRVRTALAGGGFRETEEQHFYDDLGAHVRTADLGDLAVADDDTCTRVEYARNLDAWLIATPKRVVKVSVNCSVTDYAPGDVISDERTYYDGSDDLDAPPAKGDPTREDELSGWDGATPRYTTVERSVYDAHGREVEEHDALGNKETTAYTPAVGGPVTSVTTTNALGHTESTTFQVATGDAVEQVDENGRSTTMAYDPLGRLTKVWQPGRSTDDVPDVEFEYLFRDDAPVAVTTKKLLGHGGQLATHTLFDGLLRERQVQAPAPDGGRIVTDTVYDSHGRVARTNAAYHNPDRPGTDLLVVSDQDVPAQTAFGYDGAGREVAEVLLVRGAEKWRTTTAYGGNWVSEDPPDGGTATTRLLDAEGRVVELRQYSSGSPSGDYDATRYTYTKAGEQETVTDPAGNTWRSHYDVRGRLVRVDDPDQGTFTMTYDDEDRLLSSTNSRGSTLTHGYDALGRKIATHQGDTKVLEWTFDSLGKGLPVAEIRYVDGQAYRDEVLGYNDAELPTGNAVTVPAREGALAGRYESTLTYNVADQVTSVSLPAMGDLPAEVLEQGYDQFGNADSLQGLSRYVDQTLRTNLGEVGMHIMGEMGKQVAQSFEYEDGTRRLVGATTYQENDATPVVHRELTYDPAGNITKLVNASSGRPVDTQCFRVDHLRRLTDAWTAPWSCDEEPSATGLGGPAPYWHSYTYDKIGNRLTEVLRGADGDTTRTYEYPRPGSKQLSSVRTSKPGVPDDVRSFEYDVEGNTTVRGAQSLSYDAEGHVTSVVEGDKTTSFEYDADGDRLIRRDPEGAMLYIGTTELHVDKVGLLTATRYYEHNEDTIAVRTGESLTWLSADHHGTAETSVDASSLAAEHRLRLPFGADRGEKPAGWVGDRGFVGGTEDASTGLIHLGAREYDPETGRFLSVDPIIDDEDPQQLHGYLYSNNNPLAFSDPDGLLWGWVKKAAKVVAKVSEVASYIPGPIGTAAGLAGAAAHAALGNKKKALEMAAGAAANLVPGGKLLLKAGMAVAKKVAGKTAAKAAAAKGAAKGAKATKATTKATKATGKGTKASPGKTSRVVKQATGKRTGAVKKPTTTKGTRSAGKPVKACKNSFAPGTAVLMGDNTHRPISELQVGDHVVAKNPLNGSLAVEPVLAVIVGHGDKHLVRLDLGEGGDVLTATAAHPVYVVDRGWVEAVDVEPGDGLLSRDGSVREVTGVDDLGVVAHQTVYNLTVADLHTYLVAVDGSDVLVHNDTCKTPSGKVAEENGVKVSVYANDHGPPHAHVDGGGPRTKVGQNGKPIKGSPELTPKQREVVDKYKSKIRGTLKKKMKEHKRTKAQPKTSKKSKKSKKK